MTQNICRSIRMLAVVAVVSGIGEHLSAQTLELAQEKAKQGDASGTVDAATRALVRRNYPLTAQQRYDLQMLKADAFVQLKQERSAFTTYTDAANDAPETQSMLRALAEAQLVQHSPGLSYKSSRDSTPIDITTAEGHKKAMAQLAKDMQGAVKRQDDAVLRTGTPQAVGNAFLATRDLYSLEVAAGANPPPSRDLLQQLADRMYDLLQADLTQVQARVRELEMTAHTYNGISIRGLSSPERNELRGLTTRLAQIQSQLLGYRRAATSLQGNPQRWDQMLLAAADLQARGTALLESKP